MTAPTLRTCPKEVCGQKKWGKGKVRKKIGAGAGLIFKGSGFYITDHRSEGYQQSARMEANAPTTKSEAKPAAKAESKPPAKVAKK